MAIATTVLRRTAFGDRLVVYGKSVLSGGVKTGDVATGMNYIEHFSITLDNGTDESGSSVNETFPLAVTTIVSPGTPTTVNVTLITEDNNPTVYWIAIGR